MYTRVCPSFLPSERIFTQSYFQHEFKLGQVSRKFAAAKNGQVSRKFAAAKNGQVSRKFAAAKNEFIKLIYLVPLWINR